MNLSNNVEENNALLNTCKQRWPLSLMVVKTTFNAVDDGVVDSFVLVKCVDLKH